MSKIRNLLSASAVIVACTMPQISAAQGLAGDYLSARHAASTGDFADAAIYIPRALQNDPNNPELLERAILAHISLGQVEQAADYADQLAEAGLGSQLAQSARIARQAYEGDFPGILTEIAAGRGFGPLADGLVAAWAEVGRGDMSAALSAFDVVAQMQGLAPFASYHKALAFASVGDFQSAEALFAENGRGGMERTRRGLMARAEILSQLGRNADALELLAAAFGDSFDPGLDDLRERLAKEESIPFTHITSPKDGLAEVFYTLSSALSNEDNGDVSLLYARFAEYLRPDHVPATLLSAELLEDMNQLDLAVKAYQKVPVDHPSYHAAELGRAEALRRQDKTDQALEVLTALAKSHSGLPSVHSSLGDLQRQLLAFDDAIASYTTAIALFPETTERQWFLYYARGISYERQDAWPQAEADFRQALALQPDQPNVLNYLGYSLVEKQTNLDEALEMIQRAVAARPNSGYIVDSLGWVLFRLGRYEDAVAPMETAAELMPIDPVVNDHLGDVYWAVGRKLEAEFMWKRALSFVDWEDAADEVDPERIRRKLEVGLDKVLEEEGAPPLYTAENGN